MTYADSQKRIYAGLIDAIIVYAAFFVVVVALSQMLGSGAADLLALPMLAAAWFYTPYMCASKDQATIGMKVFKLRMVNMEGGRISLKQSMLRAAIETPIVLIMAGGALYFLVFLFLLERSPAKQTFQDVIAKTLVIKAE